MLPPSFPTRSRLAPRSVSIFVSVAVAALLSLLTLGCSESVAGTPPTNPDALSGRLTLTGSSTMAPLVADIGRRFESLHPGLRIDVQTGGSSQGISDPGNGLADIGMSSRDLTEAELAERKTHLFAFDGVCFIVHKSNPVSDLNDSQLRDIFTGRIQNWSEVGGEPREITVYNRAEGRSELKLMSKFLGIEVRDFTADALSGENQQALKQVSTDKGAICYMSVGSSEWAAANGTDVKLLPLHGVEASVASVAAGNFPCARPLLFVTNRQLDPRIDAFLDYARSEAVHDLVGEHSFVPTSAR